MINKKNIIFLVLIMVLLCNHISYAAGESFSIGKTILKSIFYFLVFIIFIVFTIHATKFIAKNSKRFINSKYINIIDKVSLDTSNKIFIVEINEYIYILGIANNTIETIDKISKDDFNFMKDISFEEQLNKYENEYMGYDFKNKLKGITTRYNKIIGKEDEKHEK